MSSHNNQTEVSNNEEISLKELIFKIKEWVTFLSSKWKIIFFLGIIGGSIGFTIALFEKPTYKAVLTFAMEDDKTSSGLGGAIGLASSFGIDLGGGGGGAFAASNLAELMKSRTIVEKILLNTVPFNGKSTSLADFYINSKDLKKKWRIDGNLFLSNLNRKEFTIKQNQILNQIYNDLIDKDNLSIMQKDKKVTILTIEVNSANEFFAKYFCENLAKETSNFYIETKSKKARINVEILQKQVDSVKNELNNAIRGVATEADNVYNLNPALNAKGSASKRRQIDVQANTAILTNLFVQLELAKINLRKETPLIQLIDKPLLPLEENKFGFFQFIILGSFLTTFFTTLYLVIKNYFKLNTFD